MIEPQQFCDAIFSRPCDAKDQSDCLDCMEFVTTCDDCHAPGHTDALWRGIEQPNGQPHVLCDDCWDARRTSMGGGAE